MVNTGLELQYFTYQYMKESRSGGCEESNCFFQTANSTETALSRRIIMDTDGMCISAEGLNGFGLDKHLLLMEWMG